jgi:hypothetical protein
MNTARLTTTCLVAASLAGCDPSGGNAGIDGSGTPVPVAQSYVSSFGSVSALGSVWVNGVRYDTSTARIVIDGNEGTQAEIEPGDVVLVSGTAKATDPTQFVATLLVVDDAVQGPITTIDAATSSLVALGQTVRVAPETLFDDSVPNGSLDGLAVGDIIEVAGFRTSSDDIIATRIEKMPAGAGFETTGVVKNFAWLAQRFSIGGLTVQFGAATRGTPLNVRDGEIVEVRGKLRPGGEIFADTVLFRPAVSGGSTGDRVDIEGYVTSFDDPKDFEVAGVPVRVVGDTIVSDVVLGLDAKVAARGTADGAGTVVLGNVSSGFGGPRPPTGSYSVAGQVFTAGTNVGSVPVSIWVQQRRLGYSYTWANGALHSNTRGEFLAPNVPESDIIVYAAPYPEFFQPCAVMAHVPGAGNLQVEIVPRSAFDTPTSPRPQLAGGITVTGTVFETVNGTRQPVAGAELWAYTKTEVVLAITLTDLQGRFFLCNLQPAIWMHVSKDGFALEEVPYFDTVGAPPLEIEVTRRN